MPRVKQGRPSATEIEPRASIRWINGGAYADMGAWAKWGGRRHEPLVAAGEIAATKDPNKAALLFAERLAELRGRRALATAGLPAAALDAPTSIGAFIGFHLAAKAEVKGRRRPSETEIGLQRTRLLYAAKFLRTRGIRDLRQLDHGAVQAYMEHLQTSPGAGRLSGRGGRSRGLLDPATQRKYLDAVGNMLKRARSKGIIRTNFVEEMVDKPTADNSPTEHLEVWEAAILIEAARRLFPLSTPGLPIYPLLAWELLTGCIESEAKSREIVDLCLPGDHEYPDGVVMVRTNQGRDKLKTAYRTRYLALQPQLAEIMEEYLRSPRAPTGRLLFPGASPDEPIGDWRKQLDEIAMVAGFEPGEVRSIRFRPTFATHRAYTCDEVGQPMSALKLLAEMGHGTVKMLEERYFKAARFRRPRPHLEYRWSDYADTYRQRLAAGIAAWLSPTQARTLSALTERPMTSKEWAERLGMGPGTFFHVRGRLVQMELISRDGEGRGARWALSEDGWATAGALGAAAPHRPPLAA